MKKLILITLFVVVYGISSCVLAQGLTVKGIVINSEDKSPFSYVSVRVKGKPNGTYTDVEGRFTLLNISKRDSIEFRYMGMKPVVISARKSNLKIMMQTDPLIANEVVINGLGVRKQNRALGYAANTMVMGEQYKTFKKNVFRQTSRFPLSTFGLEGDNASYTNCRRLIMNAAVIPVSDAVRVEEFLNYFQYDMPPATDEVFSIMSEMSTCPWEPTHKLLRVGINTNDIPQKEIPQSNLVFLVDVSGSMGEDLNLVVHGLIKLTNTLRPTDKLSIVVYAGAAGVILDSASGDDKQTIIDALKSLTAGGSTAGGEGIQLAYEIAKKNYIKGGNNRIIICTDGDFNVGVDTYEDLLSLIENERNNSNVFLSVCGFGYSNYRDDFTQLIAEKGNGTYSYIGNDKDVEHEFGSLMHTVAKDAKIQVEFNPRHVSYYRLMGYESRIFNENDFDNDAVDAGEINAGRSVTALFEIVPVGVRPPKGSDPLRYQEGFIQSVKAQGANSEELGYIKVRYKTPEGNKSRLVETPIPQSCITNNPSVDQRFASAVAMYAQILADSQFKGKSTLDDVITIAKESLGSGEKLEERTEFIEMVEATTIAQSLEKQSQNDMDDEEE